MVYSKKSRNNIVNSKIIGGAYNEIKIKDLEIKDKNRNQSIVDIPTKKDSDEKLKKFINFKFK